MSRAPLRLAGEKPGAGVMVLLGFTRGDVQMAVCSASERRKPNDDSDQNVVVFIRGARPVAGGGLVADCSHCEYAHGVEEDLFQAVADGVLDVTPACDNSSTVFEISDVFGLRLEELRKKMPEAACRPEGNEGNFARETS